MFCNGAVICLETQFPSSPSSCRRCQSYLLHNADDPVEQPRCIVGCPPHNSTYSEHFIIIVYSTMANLIVLSKYQTKNNEDLNAKPSAKQCPRFRSTISTVSWMASPIPTCTYLVQLGLFQQTPEATKQLLDVADCLGFSSPSVN